MEKRLLLFRHGKSDWNVAFQNDHDRPLAKRGIKSAKTMGRLLAAAKQVPDAITTSSAVRAHATVKLAAEAGGWGCPIQVTDQLYGADTDMVLKVIQESADPIQTLLLAGHEPTWSTLTSLLVGGGKLHFPTAAMVRIDFDVDTWERVTYGLGVLVWFIQPRFFMDGKFAPF